MNSTNDRSNSSRCGVSETVRNETAWADLSFPLSDLFVQEIAPKYLTVGDFMSLGAVSRRYRSILGTRTTNGNRILGQIISESAMHFTADGELLFTEQLPTIGDLSVEESLRINPIFVNTLRQAALRRRSLIIFPTDKENESEKYRIRRQQIISQYRPKNNTEFQAVLRHYRSAGRRPYFTRPNSKFVTVNLSSEHVYIHWIDFEGNILVRDGDRLASYQEPNQRQTTSYTIVGHLARDNIKPSHVFDHQSYLDHLFALCFSDGGPPFAVYQQRRGYNGVHNEPVHTHAISILPGGRVQELHCDMLFLYARESSMFRQIVHFRCRQTGSIIGSDESSMRLADNGNDDGTEDSNTLGIQESNENSLSESPPDDSNEPDKVVETLAKAYYGFNLPSIDNTNFWFRRPIRNFTENYDGPPSLGRINPLGEAMYRQWVHVDTASTPVVPN